MQQPQNTKENERVNARSDEGFALDKAQPSEAAAEVPDAPPPRARRRSPAEDELLAMEARLELEGDPMRKEKVAAAKTASAACAWASSEPGPTAHAPLTRRRETASHHLFSNGRPHEGRRRRRRRRRRRA